MFVLKEKTQLFQDDLHSFQVAWKLIDKMDEWIDVSNRILELPQQQWTSLLW